MNVENVYNPEYMEYIDTINDLAERVKKRNRVIDSNPIDHKYKRQNAIDLDKQLLAISESPHYKKMKKSSTQTENFKVVSRELNEYHTYTTDNPGWAWTIEFDGSYGDKGRLKRYSTKYEEQPYILGRGGKRRNRKTRSKKTRRKIRI